jgi:hypothetical protein
MESPGGFAVESLFLFRLRATVIAPLWGGVLSAVALVAAVPGAAQAQDDTRTNIAQPEIRASPNITRAATGTPMRVPRASVVGADAPRSSLTCRFVCSPYVPRLVIARIAFPERIAKSPQLRLDIAAGPEALRLGDYGSVPLRAVSSVSIQPGAGPDIERLRLQAVPVYLDKVLEHRVVPRDPALQLQRLQQFQRQSPTMAAAQAPADLREALERDARSGAIEQMRVIAQGAETYRGVAQRSVIVEGMQPGLAYEIRLVQDAAAGAELVDQNMCPVPVCPADFVNP